MVAVGTAAALTGFLWGLFHFMSEVSPPEEAAVSGGMIVGLGLAVIGWLYFVALLVYERSKRRRKPLHVP